MLEALIPLVADPGSWTEVKTIMTQFLKHQCFPQQVELARYFSDALEPTED